MTRPAELSQIAYRASATGGRTAFNSSTGPVVMAANTTEQPLAAFTNPAGSGKDVFISVGEFGSSKNGLFRRYAGGSLSSLGTANIVRNMGGGSGTPAAALYDAGQYTPTGGVVSKTAHILAFYQYITRIEGASVIRPGGAVYWTFQADQATNTSTATVYFEWWEQAAAC